VIDFHEGGKIDEKALKALVRAAVSLNKAEADADSRNRDRPHGPAGHLVTTKSR